MSDTSPIPDSVPEDQQQGGAILDDELHEQLWAEIDARIAKATNASYVRLARVVAVSGGEVRVQFFSATQAYGVGFAHTMGYQYQVDQKVVVAPTEGGDFVVIGALTSEQGPHERVITNADVADAAINERAVEPQSLSWKSIVAKGLTLDRLTDALQTAIGLATTAIQPGNVRGSGPYTGDNLILTQKTGIEPGDVTGGKPGNGDDAKIVTQKWVNDKNYLKDPGSGNNAYAQKKDITDFVKSSQLAPGATGKDKLATEDYVNTQIAKKLKSKDKKGDGG